MVDGICDYGSHIVLYFILAALLQAQIGWLAWPIMAVAGISHIVQSNHIEVQRRSYQWWYYDKPWLKTTHSGEDAATRKGGLGGLASAYLAVAAGVTPITGALDAEKERRSGDPAAMERFRGAIAAQVPPLAPDGEPVLAQPSSTPAPVETSAALAPVAAQAANTGGGFSARDLVPFALVGQLVLIGVLGFVYFRRTR